MSMLKMNVIMNEKGERFVCGKCEWIWVRLVLPPQRALLRDILVHRGMKLSVSWQGLERQLPHIPILDMIHACKHIRHHTHGTLWWSLKKTCHHTIQACIIPSHVWLSLSSEWVWHSQSDSQFSQCQYVRKRLDTDTVAPHYSLYQGIGHRANCSLQWELIKVNRYMDYIDFHEITHSTICHQSKTSNWSGSRIDVTAAVWNEKGELKKIKHRKGSMAQWTLMGLGLILQSII